MRSAFLKAKLHPHLPVFTLGFRERINFSLVWVEYKRSHVRASALPIMGNVKLESSDLAMGYVGQVGASPSAPKQCLKDSLSKPDSTSISADFFNGAANLAHAHRPMMP